MLLKTQYTNIESQLILASSLKQTMPEFSLIVFVPDLVEVIHVQLIISPEEITKNNSIK